MYQVKRPARSEFVPLRGQQYHVLAWGRANSPLPPLVLVHGWMDVGASWQFVVDALSDDFVGDRLIIAPDWRGYGLTTGPKVDNYWFPDYMADLEFLLDHYVASRPIDLVGHSMGGNVVMQYAGARPERIRRLINLEGFGGPATAADEAPDRYGQWFDELKALHRGDLALRPYDTVDGVARRLAKTNPRLARDEIGRAKALWLAHQWAGQDADGRWSIRGDAAHKIINAQIFRADELIALYRRLSMPVLCIEAVHDALERWWKGRFSIADYHERLREIPDCRIEVVPDAGHMLHHDQPEHLARLFEDFLR